MKSPKNFEKITSLNEYDGWFPSEVSKFTLVTNMHDLSLEYVIEFNPFLQKFKSSIQKIPHPLVLAMREQLMEKHRHREVHACVLSFFS